MIYIGCDHGGEEIKKKLLVYFDTQKIAYHDLSIPKKGDDYPDIAKKVSRKVLQTKSKGILICGTGTGMVIAANRIKGIRASVCYDAFSAKMARSDNDANILALRGREMPFSKIKTITNIWLTTKFSNKARHKRRVEKLDK